MSMCLVIVFSDALVLGVEVGPEPYKHLIIDLVLREKCKDVDLGGCEPVLSS